MIRRRVDIAAHAQEYIGKGGRLSSLLSRSALVNHGDDAGVLCVAPDIASFVSIFDALRPQILAPFTTAKLVGLPGAAAQESMPELASVLKHFQDHVFVVTNEALPVDLASAFAPEANTVADVAKMRQHTLAVAIGAGCGFVSGLDHDKFGE